jgi:hypothetical protein
VIAKQNTAVKSFKSFIQTDTSATVVSHVMMLTFTTKATISIPLMMSLMPVTTSTAAALVLRHLCHLAVARQNAQGKMLNIWNWWLQQPTTIVPVSTVSHLAFKSTVVDQHDDVYVEPVAYDDYLQPVAYDYYTQLAANDDYLQQVALKKR